MKCKTVRLICILMLVLLFLIPIPRTIKDEEAFSLRPIVPLYEIYFFERPVDQDDFPYMQSNSTRERGVEFRLGGVPVYTRSSYSYEADGAR